MLQFIRENIGDFAGMVTLALFWLIFNLRSIKNSVDSIDKQFSDKNFKSLTDEEKEIMRKALRSSAIQDAANAFISGIVAMIVGYIVIRL